MELQTLARPYAKAAYEYANQSNAVGQWQQVLQQAALFGTDKSVQSVLKSPLSMQKKVSVVVDLITPELVGQATGFENFLKLLGQNGRLQILPHIYVGFEALKADAERVKTVQVKTPFALDDAQKTALESKLAKRYGCDVQASYDIDNTLIGGARIESDDEVIDASVLAKLSRLRETLAANAA